MTARGGGGGGGSPPTPGVPGTLALADEGAGSIRLDLEAPHPGSIGVLNEAVARISENVAAGTLPTAAGPVWAELWLLRGTGGQYLLDSGYVRGGGARGLHSVVGFVGRVNYRRGDALLATFANDTGGTLTLAAEESHAFRPEEEEEATQQMLRLSTEHDAWYRHVSKIKSDNAGGAGMTWTFTPNLGDKAVILGGRATNLDSATAFNVDAWVDASATARLFRVMEQGSATTGASLNLLTVATNLSADYAGFGTDRPEIPPGGRLLVLTGTVDQNKEVRVEVLMLIRGRKPVYALTADAGTATITETIDAVS